MGAVHMADLWAILWHPSALASNGALSMDVFAPTRNDAKAIQSVVICMNNPGNSVMR